MPVVEGTKSPRPGVVVSIKAVPGSSRTEIAGVLGEHLKVKLAAPPEDGRANRALVELLARACGVTRGDVDVISGHATPFKRVFIAGLDEAGACRKLGIARE
jgi:uncharacterized protein (TIGR00251 family)